MSKETDRIFIGNSLVYKLYRGDILIYDGSYIKFADPSVAEICIAHFDTNNDSSISYDEAAAVTDISTYFIGSAIQTFDELQYFTGLTSIGSYAFKDCRSLISITIPNNVTSIGYQAFDRCGDLISVNIPSGVTSIGQEAFFDCVGLTSLNIPSSVTSIGNNAFLNCVGLTSITVESGNNVYDSRNDCNAIIESLSNTLIVGCDNTIIPSSATSIGQYAFYGCRYLTTINIPSGVTTIGNYAFENCDRLRYVTIPNSVTSIGNEAFSFCNRLQSIEVDGGNNVYDSRNDCNAIIKTSSNKLIYGCKTTIIPNSVTSIGYRAFYGIGITSVTLGNSMTSIEEYAFRLSGLTSVTIPDSVTSIGDYAFSSCGGLTSITISNNITSIGEGVFSGTGITSVTIPSNVRSIGFEAFARCRDLTSVTVLSETPIELHSYAFGDLSQNTIIYVPGSALQSYLNASTWQYYANANRIQVIS